MKTKILILFLAIAPMMTQAQFTFTTNSGAITITGYNPAAGLNVVIPASTNGYPVTAIGTNAFYFLTTITNVTIGTNVTSIGRVAFANCSGLTSVTIGNSVTSIGDYAFYYCYYLTSVTIPNSVTNIGQAAFEECNRLTSFTIPNSVTSIGESAFVDYSLTNIAVDAANPNYSSTNGVLFDKDQATLIQYPIGLTNSSYTIPNSVTSIGVDAFAGYRLASVTIPNSVTSIGESAFVGCSGLTSVTIPDSVTSIGDYAFADCTSLTSVTIPNSVTSIGEETFANCPGLTSVTIGNSVTSIGDYAFDDCISLTSVTIPNSVTSIGDDAFAGSGLTSVTIGNSVTSIGDYAFANCISLTSVTIPNSVTSIGDYAFDDCISLTSVTIPNSVTSIGDYAFSDCIGLTSVTIGNSVTSIGESAFEVCSGLTSVTIPNSVTSIGDYAFAFCHGLNQAYFQGNAPLVDGAAGSADSTVFEGESGTVYYLPGATGWSSTFGGWPTALWYQPAPVILGGSGLGVQGNQFGFTISWATNASVVVEAATNLANPVWIPVSTSPLTNGTSYFSDPQWTNYPERFYRATSAFTVGGTLTGLPAGDTVTLQDNGGDDLTLTTNGTFTFATPLANGQSYSVTVSGTSGGTTIQTEIYPPVTANGSGTISGANVTNVAVQCTPQYTGNLDVDMYNAAVADGTANGGVPAVMVTEYGGPFRVTSIDGAPNSFNVGSIYAGQCRFITVPPGTPSCSSTILSGPAVQFGGALVCGQTFNYGY